MMVTGQVIEAEHIIQQLTRMHPGAEVLKGHADAVVTHLASKQPEPPSRQTACGLAF